MGAQYGHLEFHTTPDLCRVLVSQLTQYTNKQTNKNLMEFMYLVFTRMPDESYRGRLRSSLLYLCYVFRALINSLAC